MENNKTIADIQKDQVTIKELEHKAQQKWKWIIKHSSSPCFNDVLREYNGLTFKIETLRQRIEQRKSGRAVTAVDLVTLPKRK
jgi:hypothetical protein